MSELNKKRMQTADLNKERLEKLKKLFPDLFTIDGKLNPEELKKMIDPDLVKETERFEFKWFGKSEAKRLAFTPSSATLVYDEERSVNPEYSEGNMIIEGENLETLKCLLAGYREKVKCIYIDPPYNTGKDFVYSDKWDEDKEDYWKHIGVTEDGLKVDTNAESSGRYHSNWLNMMYSRLLVARQLLSEDGVIFISIDDNEVHHLRKLCDEVFGEDNFKAQLTILCNPKGRAQDKHFASCHEYVLVFSKNPLPKGAFNIEKEQTQLDIEYTEEDDNGKFRTLELRNTHREFGKHNRKNLHYPFYVDCQNGEVRLSNFEGSIVVLPNWDDGYEGCWTWGKPKAEEEIAFLIGKKVNGNWKIYEKDYANGSTKMLKTILSDKDYFTEKGQKRFNELFDSKNKIFQSPKSVELILKLIKTITNENEIALDFFAGSGTTAHAVMELNKNDNGNRSFILVQIPEFTDESSEAYKAGYKKISDITIERNKRVIQKIENEEAKKPPSLLDSDKKPFKTGFKVYKLAKSNFPRVDFAPDPAKTEEENLTLLNQYIDKKEALFFAIIDEKNIFDEVLLKNGFMLNYSKVKVDDFSKNNVYRIKDDFKESLICLDTNLSKEMLKEIELFKDKIFICLERALDTTMKWNLKHLLGDKLIAF